MKKTLIAASIALSMGAASNASALAIDITAMNFGSTSAASGTVDTANMGTTFSGTFFNAPWVATTLSTQTEGTFVFAGTSPEQGDYNYSVDLAMGETAFGTYFTWSVNPNIPVVAVFNQDGSSGQAVPMQVGPFPGQAPTFQGTVSAVPVPAAVWLFGSGLLGLVGVARRKAA